jgi:putative ABC transport system ATP-binding protein
LGIRLTDLSYSLKAQGDNRILADGIVAEFERGQIAAIVGPSGSGKSTLISLIGGLLSPDKGDISIWGQRWSELETERAAQRLANVGFVFQDVRLLNQLTVFENVRLPAAFRHRDYAASTAAAKQIFEELEIRVNPGLYPQTLSGGERQMIAFARALVTNPKVILADEPTAAMDWSRGRHFLEVLATRTAQSDMATLVITHDERVLQFADAVYELDCGRLKRRA